MDIGSSEIFLIIKLSVIIPLTSLIAAPAAEQCWVLTPLWVVLERLKPVPFVCITGMFTKACPSPQLGRIPANPIPWAKLAMPGPEDGLQLRQEGSWPVLQHPSSQCGHTLWNQSNSHAQLQQTRQTKQQPDSNLGISLLHSLNNLQVIEQSQTSACDTTTAYKNLYILPLLRNTIFFPLYKEVTDFACPMCRRLSCTLCINGNHEKLLVKRRRLFGCEGTCI